MAECFTMSSQPVEQIELVINSNFDVEGFGEFTEEIAPYDYSAFQPIVAVAKKGGTPGELGGPVGVAIDESNGSIFVAEYTNHRVSVFSRTGEFLKCFGSELLKSPWGIAIQKKDLYLSDWGRHTVLRFNLPSLELLDRVGKKGSGKEEFCYPQQLFISQLGDVYVCDENNHRIQVLTPFLQFKSFFKHESLTHPIDFKIMKGLMYVLSDTSSPCLHIFSLLGEKINSILSCGEGMQITKAIFFLIDLDDNIIITDSHDHSIKVFSQAGEFSHELGQQGHEKGMFANPSGICLSREGKLVCVSDNDNFGLQIFS